MKLLEIDEKLAEIEAETNELIQDYAMNGYVDNGVEETKGFDPDSPRHERWEIIGCLFRWQCPCPLSGNLRV